MSFLSATNLYTHRKPTTPVGWGKRRVVSGDSNDEILVSRAYEKAAANKASKGANNTNGQTAGTQSQTTPANSGINTLMQGVNALSGGSSQVPNIQASGRAKQTTSVTPDCANIPSGIANVQTPPSPSVSIPTSIADMYDDPASYKLRVIDGKIIPMEQQVNLNLADAKSTLGILQAQKSEAQTTVSNLEGRIEGARNEQESAKSTLDANQKQYKQSVKERDKLDENLSAVNKDYKSACENVTAKEAEKTQAQTKVSGCKTALTTAETNLQADTSEYNAAETALKNTPKTLPDGTPNPQYQVALNARDAAKIKKELSEKTLEECKKSLKTAEDELNKKEEELKEAQAKKTDLLDKLSQEESQYKLIAKNCKQFEQQTQSLQEKYDDSLKNYDTAKNNYDKLNSELESAQGIITQAEQYENRVAILQEQAAKVADLKSRAMDTLAQKEGASSQNQIWGEALGLGDDVDKFNTCKDIENQMIINAFKSDGCSGDKTAKENLVSLHYSGQETNCTGLLWNSTYGFADVETRDAKDAAQEREHLISQGYLQNSDGTITDPRTGATVFQREDGKGFSSHDFSESGPLIDRMRNQEDVYIVGYRQNGTPIVKYKNDYGINKRSH